MKKWVLLLIIWNMVLPGAFGDAGGLNLTQEEAAWVEAHRGKTLDLGLDPYSGMEYFDYHGTVSGYVSGVAQLIERELGVHIHLVVDKSWGEVFNELKQGRITLLFGANETPERLEYMGFTDPILKYPYAVFANRNSTIQTVGDLDGKRIGFIEGDFVKDRFAQTYSQIAHTPVVYPDQYAGLKAILDNEIDGFITSGGGVKQDFLFNYPGVAFIGEIDTITSDMTISTQKENKELIALLNKVIAKYRDTEIKAYITSAERSYNRKILHMTEEEVWWLDHKGVAVVGLADDYLPFDYYDNGKYKGISGAVLDKIHEITGIVFQVKKGAFNDLYNQAVAGEVDVLNLALTEDRTRYFLYPRPISTERDIIVGNKSSNPVFDVYELEGKRIAVIEGFWHEEYLRKNLKDVRIHLTKDIMESLRLLREGKVDYLIENPTVVEYYINGLGYTDLAKKGSTSKDSFVYLGVTKKNPELASIMDKALVLVDYEEMKYRGIQTVPLVQNERNTQLGFIILLMAIVLVLVGLTATYTTRQLIRQRAETEILKERAHLMYTDTLTGLYNRTYFNAVEESLEGKPFPHTVLITDLNMLKKINDTYGHHKGDALITAYARVLSEVLPGALLFRMGGDEFMAFMENCDTVCAEKRIDVLKNRCCNTALPMESELSVCLSAAVGYWTRADASKTLSDAIILADNRMYQDKKVQRESREHDSD